VGTKWYEVSAYNRETFLLPKGVPEDILRARGVFQMDLPLVSFGIRPRSNLDAMGKREEPKRSERRRDRPQKAIIFLQRTRKPSHGRFRMWGREKIPFQGVGKGKRNERLALAGLLNGGSRRREHWRGWVSALNALVSFEVGYGIVSRRLEKH